MGGHFVAEFSTVRRLQVTANTRKRIPNYQHKDGRMTATYDSLPAFQEQTGELVDASGEDYVVISAEALRRINRQEETTLGTGSHIIWYNAGKAAGSIDGRKYASVTKTMQANEAASYLAQTYSRWGWGSVKIFGMDLEKCEMMLTVKNSPLSRGITSKEPRCWFVRGFFEGLTSELLGVECMAVETACETVNGFRCEFKLTWDFGRTKSNAGV